MMASRVMPGSADEVKRRGEQNAVFHFKQVFARTFRDVAIYIEARYLPGNRDGALRCQPAVRR